MTAPTDPIISISRLTLAGCTVTITPLPSPLGYLYAEIRIIPPPVQNPGTPDEEWARWISGQPTRLPLRSQFHIIYDRKLITAFLEDAVKIYAKHKYP